MTTTEAGPLGQGERLPAREAVTRLLEPRTVALVGVSVDESKFSGQPLRNLQTAGYPGRISLVNRRGGTIRGIEASPSIDDLPDDVDVALLMVPAQDCPGAVRQLGAAGVPVAVVAVSGFAELGTPEGRALQEELRTAAQEAGVRVLGPNCNGVYNTALPLPLGYNHTHSQLLPKGKVALVSHSGAMLGAFFPLLQQYGHGLSSFVSCGNEVDLHLGDFVEHLLDDPQTEVIALILDAVTDGPAFRRAAQEAARRGKALVALKLGNSATGTSATLAHSSRLAGASAAYSAVFEADGVVSVPTLETLAIASALLAGGRRPVGRQVVATSTSGAGGILLADTMTGAGLSLPALAAATVERIAPVAGFAQVINPFDIGAAGATTVLENLRALAADPGAGSLVFYSTPTPTQAWREALASGVATVAAEHPGLPVVVVGPSPLDPAEAAVYQAAGLPVVGSLLDAVTVLEAFHVLLPPDEQDAAPAVPAGHAGAGGGLSEPESKRLLAEHGIAFPREHLAATTDEAATAAAGMGYPVVLKAAGAALTHKSELGLVVLGVEDEPSLRRSADELQERGRAADPAGYEGVLVSTFVGEGVDTVLGVTVDPDFGPMVLVGSGGVTAELIDDVALGPAPLTEQEASRLLARTHVDTLLQGYRGSPACDRAALVALMVRLSEAAVALAAEVQAVDLNPVRVAHGRGGAVALDALVVRSAR